MCACVLMTFQAFMGAFSASICVCRVRARSIPCPAPFMPLQTHRCRNTRAPRGTNDENPAAARAHACANERAHPLRTQHNRHKNTKLRGCVRVCLFWSGEISISVARCNPSCTTLPLPCTPPPRHTSNLGQPALGPARIVAVCVSLAHEACAYIAADVTWGRGQGGGRRRRRWCKRARARAQPCKSKAAGEGNQDCMWKHFIGERTHTQSDGARGWGGRGPDGTGAFGTMI